MLKPSADLNNGQFSSLSQKVSEHPEYRVQVYAYLYTNICKKNEDHADMAKLQLS